ncbi:MAG: hypothetical protein KIS63_03055 [Caldilineales bacterium]|nr:hypothetical protein [Caldilineales bacterium]
MKRRDFGIAVLRPAAIERDEDEGSGDAVYDSDGHSTTHAEQMMRVILFESYYMFFVKERKSVMPGVCAGGLVFLRIIPEVQVVWKRTAAR